MRKHHLEDGELTINNIQMLVMMRGKLASRKYSCVTCRNSARDIKLGIVIEEGKE